MPKKENFKKRKKRAKQSSLIFKNLIKQEEN